MADLKPNPAYVRQKTVSSIAALRATVERQKLELLEIEERKTRNEENISASLEAIERLEGELEKL